MLRDAMTFWTLDALYALYTAELTSEWFPYHDWRHVVAAGEAYPDMVFRGAG